MGENNSKWNNWQRINFQNIQAAHTPQYQKNKQPNEKVGKRPKQSFLQRRHTDGQQTHEKMLNITHEKWKSKLQWDITSHLSEWSSSKSLQMINAGEGVEKREHSCTACGDINWYSHYRRWYGDSFKKFGIKPPYDLAIPLLGIYPEETKVEKDTCIPLFTAAPFTIGRTWKQPRHPSTDEWIKSVYSIYTMEHYSAIKRTYLSQFWWGGWT